MLIAIKVENVSKRYFIGHQRQDRYRLISEVVSNSAKKLLSMAGRPWTRRALLGREEFWALKDVSFEVLVGEQIGIIGRNGAGKSTLLKILSRITAPTAGRISVRGRVASLLEVGTGFHPELTGRENIYLNGSVMGMGRADIKKKFDEIVSFSGVERFLDTPVKRYSSGMYVRLAFAVAAHLEPEILVIDEVLAVGDAQFQKKCLGKMELAGKEGRTVIFVSHNLTAVEVLCSKSMLIEGGKSSPIAPSKQIIRDYLAQIAGGMGGSARDRKDRTGKGRIKVVDVRFVGAHGGNQYMLGEDVCIQLEVESIDPSAIEARLSLGIYGTNDIPLISCDSLLTGEVYTIPGSSLSTIVCKISSPPLNLGEYYVSFALFNNNGEPEDWISSLCSFSIGAGEYGGRLAANHFPVLSNFEWKVDRAHPS